MKNTADYWSNLSFDYLTTYSLLRGPKWERLQKAAKEEAQRASNLLLTCAAPDLSALRENLRFLRNTNDLQTSTLTEVTDTYNLTATPVASIAGNDYRVRTLMKLLSTPATNVFHWMCAPIYRDAIAFYNSNDELVSVLNICFGCDRMITERGDELDADTAVYASLRDWLLTLGHDIESAVSVK